MRTGRFQQKTGEEAGNIRNAEVLFETRSIADISQVEARTRKDIEEKKEELRQLVGASYRDLIESADSILAMRRSCEAVVGNVASMERDFASLKSSIGTARGKATPMADQARKRKEALYGVSCRVKYLVDTPEKIWGCLDEHLYLEGAERYLRAKEVHELLLEQQQEQQQQQRRRQGDADVQGEGSGRGADVVSENYLAKFPLLRHQWPLVETFRSQISQRSRDRLQDQTLGVGDSAVALAAIAVIDGLSCADVLSLFLDSRRTWIRSLLRGQTTGPDSRGAAGTIAGVLSRVIGVIQASLCAVGQLFLEVAAADDLQRRPLLFSTLLAAPPESQLFGGIPDPEHEVARWKAQREQLEQAAAVLPSKHVSEAARAWLSSCAQDLAADGKALLAGVARCSDLAQAEAAVRQALADRSAFADSLAWLASAFGREAEHPWESVCELVLREPVDLWPHLLEGLFSQRAKELVAGAFDRIALVKELDAVLERVRSGAGREGKGKEASGAADVNGVGTHHNGPAQQNGVSGGPRLAADGSEPLGDIADDDSDDSEGDGDDDDWGSALLSGKAQTQGLGSSGTLGPDAGSRLWALGGAVSEASKGLALLGKRGGGAGGGPGGWTSYKSSPGVLCFEPEVRRLRDLVDDALQDVLLDLLAFLVGVGGSGSGSVGGSGSGAGAGAMSASEAAAAAAAAAGVSFSSGASSSGAALAAAAAVSPRTADLAPFLQSCALEYFTSLVNVLEQKLLALHADSSNSISGGGGGGGGSRLGKGSEMQPGTSQGADRPVLPVVAVEKALLIGRLCAALGRFSPWLGVVLGPPGLWVSTGLTALLQPQQQLISPSSSLASLTGAAATSSSTLGSPDTATLLDRILTVSRQQQQQQQQLRGGTLGRRYISSSTVGAGDLRWLPASSASGLASSASAAGGKAGGDEWGQLKSIQRELRRVTVAAHQPWVERTARRLCTSFQRHLLHGDALSTTIPLKGWEETVVKQAADGAEDTSSSGGGGGGGGLEMKMLLPAMPSSYALACLFRACRALHHATGGGGSHSLDAAVLRSFAWRLAEGVYDSYEAVVRSDTEAQATHKPSTSTINGAVQDEISQRQQPPQVRLSEKGVLQLLFDVRFVADVLAGGLPVSQHLLLAAAAAAAAGRSGEGSRSLQQHQQLETSPRLSSQMAQSASSSVSSSSSTALTTAGTSSALLLRSAASSATAAASEREAHIAARKRRVAALLESLHSRLDPIDWAAYEPYLWANEQRFYLRSSVLLGNLVQLQRLHTDVNVRHHHQPYSADANSLHAAPPAPRFTYLPISSPILAGAGGAGQRGNRGRRGSTVGLASLQSSAPGARAAAAAALADLPLGRGGSSQLDMLSGAAAARAAELSSAAMSFADSTGLSAAPLFKSLMGQVKLGSILSDGGAQISSQMGRNISTGLNLGDMMLPASTSITASNAAAAVGGLFSSLTTAASASGSSVRHHQHQPHDFS